MFIAPVQGRDQLERVHPPAPFMGEGRVLPRGAMDIDKALPVARSFSLEGVELNTVIYKRIPWDHVTVNNF
jgi:hypothetical protein